MRILLVATAFNSLTQRVFAELDDLGHSLAVELALGDDSLRAAVEHHQPELIIAPMLVSAIPPDIWSTRTCLIVHPGPPGDRGPSSLDWAIHEGATEWGVTVLQAEAEMDAGAVWAWQPCRVPPVGKSDLYRNEIADAAVTAVLRAVERFAAGEAFDGPFRQTELDLPHGIRTRPYLTQDVRRIDWETDPTRTVLRKLRAADSRPGVLDELLGARWFLHGGHEETGLTGRPGTLLATREGAVCRATADSAVWLPRLRPRRRAGGPATFALPATEALGDLLPPLPEVPAPTWEDEPGAFGEIRYREEGAVGLLSFSFPGGAMSTARCRRLLDAYHRACSRPTAVLVLGGQRDFFGNGIDLNAIEAADDPAAESWANINAMDDLVEAVLTTTDRLVVTALGGNAAAGGALFALAADEVWCRHGAVLNPHYRLMGLYGSEYWTYTLPRRVGDRTADRLMREALPVGARRAERLGLVDRVVERAPEAFAGEVSALARRLAAHPRTQERIAAKKSELDRLERTAPAAGYRERELARMRTAFFDPGQPYHAARRAFVRKERPECTPEHLRDLPERQKSTAVRDRG